MSNDVLENDGVNMAANTMDGDNETILVAYGSNLSPGALSASEALDRLVGELKRRGIFINKISRLWRSQAWPDPNDPPYVNAVLDVKGSWQPVELLEILHEVERASGRVRDGRLNMPRVLDLDLIAFGDRIINNGDGLILPHPRAHERGFVMGPLSDILPGWVHPVLGKTAAELWAQVSVGADAHPLPDAS